MLDLSQIENLCSLAREDRRASLRAMQESQKGSAEDDRRATSNGQTHHSDALLPKGHFHVIWLCVKHHNSFHIWEGYQFLQSSGVNLKPCVDLEEMLSASLAELRRQRQARVRRDREARRPEVFGRIKAMLERHRFIGDDQKYRYVESSEILEWLSEATGGKQP